MGSLMHMAPEELAQRWRMSKNTLARWRVTGSGPVYIKLGRSVLYRLADVEAFEQRAARVAAHVLPENSSCPGNRS